MAPLYCLHAFSGSFFVLVLLAQSTTAAAAASTSTSAVGTVTRSTRELRDYTFADLLPCTYTSLELSKLGADVDVEPCILADVQPAPNNSSPTTTNRTALVTSVQVTPVGCAPHRDGAITAAHVLNADNGGRGVAIGFQQDFYCQFRHVSVIAGNPAALGTEEYNRRHTQLLENMVTTLGAQYIAGTCSFASSIEKESARRLKRMVLTMVGPPGFYKDGPDGTGVNPYVFGIHINSDTYGIPAIQQLAFLPQGPETIPIRVIYRTQSEFFYSTCQSVLNAAEELGFKDIEKVLYEHDGDHDGDGEMNQFDEDFLGLLADQICPSNRKDDGQEFYPAIFACTLTEQNILLEKWRENGCQPYAMWMTPSTWGWAQDNPEVVPYFQGGGQWHPAFSYGDKYFDTGADLLTYNEDIFGYRGSYDMVVSYAMVVLFSQHLQAAYRILDEPDPASDFATEEGYERLRRDMIILNVETIFGTVSFNEFQRNEGRGAAGTQWLPVAVNGTETGEFSNFLISPFLQAERAAVAPGPVATPCDAGSLNNITLTESEESLMLDKCSACPVDTFTSLPNLQLQCDVCPGDSTTEFKEGQTFCTTVQDDVVGVGLRVLGNFGVLCTWAFAIYFASWTFRHRDDAVVKIGQAEFLILICVGAMVSSASVVFLSFEAESGEDDKWADIGCKVAPFLYAAGWVTEYSSLSVKTYRLFRITSNQTFRRVKILSYQMFIFVFLLVLVDMALITCMTIITPLSYTREITNRDVSDNVVTIKTSGSCVADGNAWAFLGPVIALHGCLQILTNWLLCKVRGVNDRYQEQKYVALASLFVLEIIVIGVPVLVAVQDSPAARYIVMAAIVVFNDIGILCFVFLPKMQFRKVGLPEGVNVAESINRESMNRAISRRTQSFVMRGQSSRMSYPTSSGSDRGGNEGSDGGSNEEEMASSNHSKSSRTKTPTNVRRPFGSKHSGLSTGSENSYRADSWAGVGFKSSVADNLHSIAEASGEISADLTSSPVRRKKEGSESSSKNGPELISEVQARVREKLAQRINQAESFSKTGAPDKNTDLAVGAAPPLSGKLPESPLSPSEEFETEAGKDRLMNRLGASQAN